MKAATVVQVLHGLFYVLLQLLVVAPIILSFKFYCKFYCSCDPSLSQLVISGVGSLYVCDANLLSVSSGARFWRHLEHCSIPSQKLACTRLN